MPSSLNLAGVFTDALNEHISIIRQLEAQQDSFERAAILITDSLLARQQGFLVRQRRKRGRLTTSGR